jgi:hypothetical protein
MRRRNRAGQPTYDEVLAEAFDFLHAEGFVGPETTQLGHIYRRPGLHIEIWLHLGRESEVSTLVERFTGDGTREAAWLECLYVASGCGPAQDVPGSVQSGRVMFKRLRQQAAGLERLLPAITGPEAPALFARCPTTRHSP